MCIYELHKIYFNATLARFKQELLMIDNIHDWSDFNATLARFKRDKPFLYISIIFSWHFNATLARFKLFNNIYVFLILENRQISMLL